MPIKIQSVIICDDIRKEITGKDILIGVYAGGINVPSYPVTLPLAFWIVLDPEQSSNYKCEITIQSPSGNPPIKMEAEIEVGQPVGPGILALSKVPIRIENDGDITVSLKVDDVDFGVVKSTPVSRSAPSL